MSDHVEIVIANAIYETVEEYNAEISRLKAERDELKKQVILQMGWKTKAQDDLEDALDRIAQLEDALRNLVNKLNLVREDKYYKAMWALAWSHNGPYTGPTYEQELERATEALKGGSDGTL